MDYTANQEFDELARALVAAFPGYLHDRLDELGVAVDGAVAEAVDAAIGELSRSLQRLAQLPPQDQVKSPLELVRDATVPISAVLAAGAVAPVPRDEWAVAIHPEDVYELYPASSRDLGEEAWQMHLAWGIDKARVVGGMVPAASEPPPASPRPGPAVALFGIADRGPLIADLERRGYRCLVWRNPAALATTERPVLVLVDLRHPTAHDAIRSLNADGTRVVAVSDRVDDFVMAGVMALGAEEVVELRHITGRLDRLLPHIV